MNVLTWQRSLNAYTNKNNHKQEYHNRLSKDETLTEAAALGIAGTTVILNIMQNYPEVKNLIKNLKGNHKLQAKVVATLLEDPEIAKAVVDISKNDDFKKGVSNLDNKLRKKFKKIGLSIARRYTKKTFLDIVWENKDMFSVEQDNLTLENGIADFLAKENHFIENFTEIGSKLLGETIELIIEDAGEVTSEVMDSLVGLIEWIGEII
ncbi:hypothetical protein [Moorena sp. SIO3H5]|uniref:hypothetical protein n=1 Tax=Moorena sp. SIO3H5 TaxID=2607834 RepID=UPI0013BBBBD1|nr:hypothetical protein [Moorena sp. SIO3H5]NEO69807.1 hypothetical protein [Moorena sp. SIO3H5]